MLDSDQQWIAPALALVSQREGNEAWIITFQLTEYRPNMRGITVDIRDHHDHIARTQLWIGTETREQLIVKDLYFTLSAVSDVKTDRLIFLKIYGWPAFARLVQWTQFEDVVLQLVEHVQRQAVAEQVDATVAKRRAIAVGIVVAVEQVDVVAPLLAPYSQ
ncbi:hypothetical protein D3C85_707070 [compost metagenome]